MWDKLHRYYPNVPELLPCLTTSRLFYHLVKVQGTINEGSQGEDIETKVLNVHNLMLDNKTEN